MHLGRGWKEFVRANGVELGQLLVFCYDGAGAALLTVKVFDDSECGRHCSQREEENDSVGTFPSLVSPLAVYILEVTVRG
uniref:TF-B3 domain-containing protein n=1 Tax=Aegilops tauschii subsp. strangulata TaxID=200361 RepID=A0A453G6S1_AEGTS